MLLRLCGQRQVYRRVSEDHVFLHQALEGRPWLPTLSAEDAERWGTERQGSWAGSVGPTVTKCRGERIIGIRIARSRAGIKRLCTWARGREMGLSGHSSPTETTAFGTMWRKAPWERPGIKSILRNRFTRQGIRFEHSVQAVGASTKGQFRNRYDNQPRGTLS